MKPLFCFYLVSLILLIQFAACDNASPKEKMEKKKITFEDIQVKVDTIFTDSLPIKISYHLLKADSALFDSIRNFSDEKMQVLYLLNRTDPKYIYRQDTLLFPDTFLTDINRYCPFPLKHDSLASIQKIIFISYELQLFAAYENGLMVRWGPVSMGKRSTPTPTGLFHTNWKAKRTVSTIDEEWIMNWYFNLDNFEGVSMHEYDLPGYPASHACIRMLEEDARWNYNWSQQWILIDDNTIAAYGTPVIIYGEYPFGKRRPWRNLSLNADTLNVSLEALHQIYREHLPLINTRQLQRDSLQTPAVL